MSNTFVQIIHLRSHPFEMETLKTKSKTNVTKFLSIFNFQRLRSLLFSNVTKFKYISNEITLNQLSVIDVNIAFTSYTSTVNMPDFFKHQS